MYRVPVIKFGLFDINQGACLNPTVLMRTAQQAEAAGLESLWAGEHVVLPDPRLCTRARSCSTADDDSVKLGATAVQGIVVKLRVECLRRNQRTGPVPRPLSGDLGRGRERRATGRTGVY
jgi:hypothetical protein